MLLGEELLKLDLRKTNKIVVYANPKLAKIYTRALKHLETKKEIICVPEKKLAKSQALGQFKISRVSFISSLPRGEPCAEDLPSLFGDPKPILVLQLIKV